MALSTPGLPSNGWLLRICPFCLESVDDHEESCELKPLANKEQWKVLDSYAARLHVADLQAKDEYESGV